MKTLTRTLTAAAVALVVAGPAFASVSQEITLYDQPQQQDGFFLQDRGGVVPDVSATGSIGGPSVAPAYRAPAVGETPFWAAHELIRLDAQDNS